MWGQNNDDEAESLLREHTLPIMGPERLQEVGSCLTLETMEKMVRPFAMPPEDFPPASTPVGFSGYFSKSAAVLERLVNLFHNYKNSSSNGKSWREYAYQIFTFYLSFWNLIWFCLCAAQNHCSFLFFLFPYMFQFCFSPPKLLFNDSKMLCFSRVLVRSYFLVV